MEVTLMTFTSLLGLLSGYDKHYKTLKHWEDDQRPIYSRDDSDTNSYPQFRRLNESISRQEEMTMQMSELLWKPVGWEVC